jgi:carbonic anhydrase
MGAGHAGGEAAFPSRRGLVGVAAGALLLSRGVAIATAHGAAPEGPTPDVALARLMAGNARYVAGASKHPHLERERRVAVAAGQHPFATILACADSRVAPELVFDQGLGDLFVVRVAGNVVDDAVLGSIEYSVVHLGAPLVMVLGHQRCGAVTAALEAAEGKSSAEDADTKIGALAALITPAVQAVPANAPDRLDAAIVENARRAAGALISESAPLRERVAARRLRIVSARYSLDDGKVTLVRDAQAASA